MSYNERSRKNLKPPWKPGVSANPGGRPARKPITDALVRALTEKRVGTATLPGGRTLLDVIVEAWVRNIINGDQRAIADLMDRIEGKVGNEPHRDDENPMLDALREFLNRRPTLTEKKEIS